MAIAYVEHPLSQEDKLKYLKRFDKIIDIKFAPQKLGDGDELFTKHKPRRKTKPKVDAE